MLVWNYDCKSYYAAYNENLVNAVNTFRWNQQTRETSVIERVWGDPHLYQLVWVMILAMSYQVMGKQPTISSLMEKTKIIHALCHIVSVCFLEACQVTWHL